MCLTSSSGSIILAMACATGSSSEALGNIVLVLEWAGEGGGWSSASAARTVRRSR